MRIYVGNLSYRSSEQDVHKAFMALGQVTRTQLAIDPATGRSAGFAYVEMPDEEEAQSAIARLNGKEINSRVVTVSQATVEEPAVRPDRERLERPARTGRFERDGADTRRHAPRRSSSSPTPPGQRPRSGGPARSGGPSRDGRRDSVWDQRNRSEPPSEQRRNGESQTRQPSKGPPSADAPVVQPSTTSPESPAVDNPWTRRRPPSP